MAQWGVPQSIEGITVVPVIWTEGFREATPEDNLGDLVLADPGLVEDYNEVFERIKEKYLGQPYGKWLGYKDYDRPEIVEPKDSQHYVELLESMDDCEVKRALATLAFHYFKLEIFLNY